MNSVTLSARLMSQTSLLPIAYANVLVLKQDSSFVSGALSNEDGRVILPSIRPGNYIIQIKGLGFQAYNSAIEIGYLSEFIDLGLISLIPIINELKTVEINGEASVISSGMEKKTFDIATNSSQAGGSVLQALQNLPSVSISQDGKITIRGSERVAVLIDGKQTALTGFGNQAGLDNIPASAIEKVEIINNPSSKYDANGNAGVINIIFKKNQEFGLHGKANMIGGIGMLNEKRASLPGIRPQYLHNPKVNPSISLNHRNAKRNLFLQADVLEQKALNKNEFIQRTYDDGTVINQQFLENRTQYSYTIKAGIDSKINEKNSFSFSGMFNKEAHIDRGDLPYYNADTSFRQRLWLYYENEVNTSANANARFTHQFKEPGHKLEILANYTFHREDEVFNFDDILPNDHHYDTTHLIYNENVSDVMLDYVKPLKHGRLEAGTKFRWRYIPATMTFQPGASSILDPSAAGWANYDERIAAAYTNYVFERNHFELEAGLRLEGTLLKYTVDPTMSTYKSNGYQYFQPFPNVRIAWKFTNSSKIALFYNRRVDRPDEADLRAFPKYDDPEVLKTGNPALRPMYSNNIELGWKKSVDKGSFYAALYNRASSGIITRINTTTPGSTLINSISQNAGKGNMSGVEMIFNRSLKKWLSVTWSASAYYNSIGAFAINNVYPLNVSYSAAAENNYSGNSKVVFSIRTEKGFNAQLSGSWYAADVIPQGKTAARGSVDIGIRKSIQKGKGELFLNGSDIFNTLRVKKTLRGNNFNFVSNDLYETQIFRVGYSYKF